MHLPLVSRQTAQGVGHLLIQNPIGRLKPEPMITGKIQMDEVEENGFKALVHDKDNHIKILVDVGP